MLKYINKYGFVELVDKMGTDLTVVNAARVSMGKRKDVLDEKDVKLINYLGEHKHTSPMRHVQVQFHIKAPEVVARQWIKHQIGADYTFKDSPINEISGRYVSYSEEFYIPEVFRKQSDSVKQGSSNESVDNAEYVSKLYQKTINETYNAYQELLEAGVAKEIARMLLPTALYTEWYWTASLQAVKHFVNLRADSHAQFEIREYAVVIDEMMRELFPNAWSALDK